VGVAAVAVAAAAAAVVVVVVVVVLILTNDMILTVPASKGWRFLEKLLLGNKLTASTETEISLLCSQEPTILPCPNVSQRKIISSSLLRSYSYNEYAAKDKNLLLICV
jgi:hypothetical protein